MLSMSAVDSSAYLQYSTNHSTNSCARYICGWCLMVIWKTFHLVSTVDTALLLLWTWRQKMEQQWCLGRLWKQAAGGQPESYSYRYTGRWFSVKFMLRVSDGWRQMPSCDRKRKKRSAASWFGSLCEKVVIFSFMATLRGILLWSTQWFGVWDSVNPRAVVTLSGLKGSE